MALFNGFAVTVCRSAREYRGAWSVAGVTVKHDMPDDLAGSFKPDRRSWCDRLDTRPQTR
jgi:xanthine dehydrogenase accessory factor